MDNKSLWKMNQNCGLNGEFYSSGLKENGLTGSDVWTLGLWWCCLGRVRRCGCAGGGVSPGVGFDGSNRESFPDALCVPVI